MKKKAVIGTVAGAAASVAAVYAAIDYFFKFAIVRTKEGKKTKHTASQGEMYVQMAEYSDIIEKGKEWMEAQDWEILRMKSFDGLNLAGELLVHPDAIGTIIMVHGYKGHPHRDFRSAADYFYSRGLNVFMPHHRAHGMSEGKYITYGVHECYDLVDWIDVINERFGEDKDVFLDGVSMGATTVLMASGEGLPENVRAIIADCAFTSPYDIFAHIAKKDFKLPAFPFIDMMSKMSKKKAGFGFKDNSTVMALKRNRTPIFFAHGTADDFVPTRMVYENYDACSADKELFVVKRAMHGMSYLVDMEGYKARVEAFFDKHSTYNKK